MAKRSGQSDSVGGPAERFPIVDLSVIAREVLIAGPVPPRGRYLDLTVEDVGQHSDGKRLVRLCGPIRSVASALRFIGHGDRARLLLAECGLPEALAGLSEELQA